MKKFEVTVTARADIEETWHVMVPDDIVEQGDDAIALAIDNALSANPLDEGCTASFIRDKVTGEEEERGTKSFELIEEPAAPDLVQLARDGLEHLRQARACFQAADNRGTLKRVRLAISSAKGAVRANDYRRMRIAEGR